MGMILTGLGGGTPGGSTTQIQFNNAGVFGGASGLTWDGTNLTVASTSTIIQTPTGTTEMTLVRMHTPTSAENTSPFELHLGGATLGGIWDPCLNFGYNASEDDATQPVMRQVIEGLYRHGTDDFEMYWEYLSTDGLTMQRPIFFIIERDGATPGALVFNVNGLNINRVGSTADIYIATDGNDTQGTVFTNSGSGISAWAGNVGTDAGWRAYASPFSNTNYSGAFDIRASADGGGASTDVSAFSIQLITDAKTRMRVHDDGKIAFNYDDAGTFTDYERYAINLTAGLMTFAAESGGAGAADMGFAFTAKGAGAITMNNQLIVNRTVLTSTYAPSFIMVMTADGAADNAYGAGFEAYVAASNANDIATIWGTWSYLDHAGSGAAFAMVCHYIYAPVNSGIGTVVDAHGIYIEDFSSLVTSGKCLAINYADKFVVDKNGNLTAPGMTLADAGNIVVNATTGTKIGTATTQKLSFYNATPIVQGASVADATGGAIIDAEARSAINALISRIESLGLIATI